MRRLTLLGMAAALVAAVPASGQDARKPVPTLKPAGDTTPSMLAALNLAVLIDAGVDCDRVIGVNSDEQKPTGDERGRNVVTCANGKVWLVVLYQQRLRRPTVSVFQ